MSRTRLFLRKHWGDLLVVALLLFALAEIVWEPAWDTQEDGSRLSDASTSLEIAFAFLWTLPLLARRRSGLAAGLTVGVATATLALISNPATDSVALFLAFLGAAAAIGLHEDRVRAVAGGIALYACGLVIDSTNPGGISASDVFVFGIFAFGPVAAGQVVRYWSERTTVLAARARHLEELQAAQTEAAVAEERARIADELHDVIAQGVSVMTLQAGGARMLLREDPARARIAIEAVEEAGREALAETRRLLGILRRDSTPERAPQPSLADLDALFQSARAAGAAMSLHVEGEPRPLSPGVGLAAYRVVADACAFTEDQGGVAAADVTLRWLPRALEIEVAGDGSADGDASARLVARVAERIRLYGGTLETARRAGGAGVFTARIPTEVPQ